MMHNAVDAPESVARPDNVTELADGPMNRLLDGACGVDLGNGWRHFTIIACCNEWAVTAKRHYGRWAIKSMVVIPST